MSTYTHQALHLPEILTNILFCLDMKTLLLSQRVSESWATLIQTYTPLQQSLFFRSATQNTGLALNPLLAGKFPACFVTEPSIIYSVEAFNALQWKSSPQAESGYKRSESSWRKMLVCQPAPK